MRVPLTLLATLAAFNGSSFAAPVAVADGVRAAGPRKVEVNQVAEFALVSERGYPNPCQEIELDALFTQPDGSQLRVPAFWAGGNRWCFRYASPTPGTSPGGPNVPIPRIRSFTACKETWWSWPARATIRLYRHGPIRVARDRRHFEHADGTPFFWLGDTWWKNLCKRMTWEGFQELTADRKAKGFTVVQIVCGAVSR